MSTPTNDTGINNLSSFIGSSSFLIQIAIVGGIVITLFIIDVRQYNELKGVFTEKMIRCGQLESDIETLIKICKNKKIDVIKENALLSNEDYFELICKRCGELRYTDLCGWCYKEEDKIQYDEQLLLFEE